MAHVKQIDVWVLSIEDCGDPAESWVFGTNEEARAKLREFLTELAVGAHQSAVDYEELKSLESPEQVNDVAANLELVTESYAAALMTVEQIMLDVPPDVAILEEVLWDNRVVWLERHTLTLAARAVWSAA